MHRVSPFICVILVAATKAARCATVPSTACPAAAAERSSCDAQDAAPTPCVPPRKPSDTSKPYCFTPNYISPEAQEYLSTSYAAMLRVPSAEEMLSNATAVQQLRQVFDNLTSDGSAFARKEFFASTEDSTVGIVPVVIAIPKTNKHPQQEDDEAGSSGASEQAESALNSNSSAKLLVYFHGGGYVMGSCHSSGWLTVGMVAHFSGLPVLCVDYRLAPEHPFPAALDDAFEVYKTLIQQYGYNPKNLAVLGDSAGGGMSMALLQILVRQQLPMPGAVGLYSPWLELSGEVGDTLTTLTAVDPQLQHEVNGHTAAMAYVAGDKSMLKDPLVSPLHGDYSSASFPPTLIQVGLRDCLLSSSTMLYRKMREGGQTGVVFSPWEAMWHVFEAFLNVPEAHAANQEMAAFFVEHLGAAATGQQ